MNQSDLGSWCQMLWSSFICCCKMSPILLLGSEKFAEELHHRPLKVLPCGAEVLRPRSCLRKTPAHRYVFVHVAEFKNDLLPVTTASAVHWDGIKTCSLWTLYMSPYCISVTYLLCCLHTTSRWHYIDESHVWCPYWDDRHVLTNTNLCSHFYLYWGT